MFVEARDKVGKSKEIERTKVSAAGRPKYLRMEREKAGVSWPGVGTFRSGFHIQ